MHADLELLLLTGFLTSASWTVVLLLILNNFKNLVVPFLNFTFNVHPFLTRSVFALDPVLAIKVFIRVLIEVDLSAVLTKLVFLESLCARFAEPKELSFCELPP